MIDQNCVKIVPGSYRPCACGGGTHCDLKIPLPEEGASLQGVRDALIVCRCGAEIPCKVSIDLGRHRDN